MKCVSEQTWRQFVAGELTAPDSATLQAHAANCPSCGELVRQPAEPHRFNIARQHQIRFSRLDNYMANTKSFLNTKEEVPDDGPELDLDAEVAEAAFDSSLLTPAVRSDSMGRLGEYEVLKTLGQGACGGGGLAPECRGDSRGRRTGGRSVSGHGVDQRAVAARADQGPDQVRAAGGHPTGSPNRLRSGRRACSRGRASRHPARQHPAGGQR